MNPSRNASPDRDEELEALVCDCLDLLLPILPSGQKDVVYAIDVEGKAPQTVADELEMSLDEVSTLLAIGRQGVKEQLNMMVVAVDRQRPQTKTPFQALKLRRLQRIKGQRL